MNACSTAAPRRALRASLRRAPIVAPRSGTAACLALAGLLAGGLPAAWAQGTPAANLPSIQQLTPPLPRAESNATRLPGTPGRPAPELAHPGDDLKLDVKGFDLDGGPPELQAALAGLTARYTGEGRGWEDLLAAAADVTRYLQGTLGRYLGHAYIPAQKPVGGRVRIQVLEGRLDRVVLDWPANMPVQRAAAEALLAQLKPGSVLLIAEVERVVFLLNDLRGVTARFEFNEGREWGTAELRVVAQPEARLQHRVELDGDGSRYSGTTRLGAQTLVASPLGRGDALTLSAQASTTGGMAFALAGYTLPVGGSGLKLGASASAFRYRFDRALLPQDVRGNAAAGTAYALYPVRRSRNLNLFALASLEHKRFTDTQGDGDALQVRKHSQELRLGLSGDFRDEAFSGGVNTFELGASSGQVQYDQNAPASTDDASRFTKLTFGVTRLQNLVTHRALLYANLRGQVAMNNLDATQQFRLGGADGVRAYAPGETAGDSGALLSLELRLLPPEAWFGRLAREFVGSVFYDVGQVRLRQDPSQRAAGFVNQASLGGPGLGLVWERPGSFSARVYAAWPTLGQATGDTGSPKPRVYAQASKTL